MVRHGADAPAARLGFSLALGRDRNEEAGQKFSASAGPAGARALLNQKTRGRFVLGPFEGIESTIVGSRVVICRSCWLCHSGFACGAVSAPAI